MRLRDNLADPGTDIDASDMPGYQTRVPVVRWDPVPGASSYEVQVAAWTGSTCSWAALPQYVRTTAVAEWSPLSAPTGNPIVWQGAVAADIYPQVTPGTHCFRVRARSDRAAGNQEVWGD